MPRRRNERTYRQTIRDREGEERDRAVLQEGFGVRMICERNLVCDKDKYHLLEKNTYLC